MRRHAALEQLGIDIYVPRRPLARGLPSLLGLQAALSSPATARIAEPASPANGQRSAEGRMPALDLPETPGKSVTKPSVATPKPQSINTIRLQLLTVAFGNEVLFISDLKSAPLRADLESAVLQFLRELMFALGRPVQEPVAARYFQWPLVDKPGADAGAERARDVLAGYVEHQLEDSQPRHLVLLGASCADNVKLPESLRGTVTTHLFPSGMGSLFAKPALKAQLWQALQALIVCE